MPSRSSLLLALLCQSAIVSACVLPTTPISNTILTPFSVQVQNASRLDVHNKLMTFLPSGGGDQHLHIGPVGNPVNDMTLVDGVLTNTPYGVRAVIGGEFSEIDETIKIFTTERGDPRAVFAPRYACNPNTDAVQIELDFVTWQNHPAGGWVCVRPTYDNAHEFRYYPPANTKSDPNRYCIKVTLVVIPSGPGPVSSSTTFVTSTTAVVSSSIIPSPSTTISPPASSSTTTAVLSSTTVSPIPSSSLTTTTSAAPSPSPSPSTSSTTTTTSATTSSSPLPYTDLRSSNFAFIGCAPEEDHTTDGKFRTLSGALYADDLLTNQKCLTFCTQRGYKYAGTEYRRECWCGNSYAPTRQPGTTAASLNGCDMRCGGDNTQYCGGGGWLSLYIACPVGGPCVNAVFT